jgi:2-amino-4-hydroxy-6-hydroxymethyldihydropteridine diphosphokinase
MGWVKSFVAIGANLGDCEAAVRQAMQDIGALPSVVPGLKSSLYRTAPVDSSGPEYINAVVEISTELPPLALLHALQQLENRAQRLRPYRNAPRTLDLDILLYGDTVIDTPELSLPHPRMGERAFVLLPLHEIAPDRVSTLQLQRVSGQIAQRLP